MPVDQAHETTLADVSAAVLSAATVRWRNATDRFGGFKESGVGREEDGAELLTYTQVKAINVALGGR
jgi:acyl-CoA reductase-like NAD-dependent aldehyde dehydrogenase